LSFFFVYAVLCGHAKAMPHDAGVFAGCLKFCWWVTLEELL
jgi:hypothetical protein